ncbi:MAG: CRISPR-associated helicase Cas3' [Candidatus Binatia bacterium]
MRGQPTDFWGKLEQRDSGAVIAWHPLAAHAADVAACCEALLHSTILRSRFARLAGKESLSNIDIARLSALAALHDVGKFNSGFQRKGFPGSAPTAGHVSEVLALLSDSDSGEQRRLLESIPFAHFRSWAPDLGALRLLVAAIGHHGRPMPIIGSKHQSTYWRPFHNRDPFDGIAALTEQIRTWFPDAFRSDAGELPANAAFQHAYSGLVMLADWLGSDTRFFSYAESNTDRMPYAREKARYALQEAWVDTSRARTALGAESPGFSAVSRHRPRPAQSEIATVPIEPGESSLVVLESETGSGKTEAALAHFVRLFHAGEIDGLYFALPTRTAATQIHARVSAAVELAFPSDARPPVVLAVPGYLNVDGHTARALPGFAVLWNDDPKQRFRYRGWAAEHPKRFLAGSVVVGTVDQVLLSTLMVSHAHMRATSLLRHLLVIDEVHASDAYMTGLLGCVLDNHLAAGGHALLMSATLGASARMRLLARSTAKAAVQSVEAEIDVPYPLLSVRVGARAPSTIAVQSHDADKVVLHTLRPWMADAGSIATAALAAAQRGAGVLVLRNTVADCLATQRALEAIASAEASPDLLFSCNGQLAPHHARFSKEDRQALDHALEARVSSRSGTNGLVVVATQTVQQSLDLDFDFLLTDLCPMDVLLQRIGRLHRHARRRPGGFTEAAIVILVPDERELSKRISGKDGRPTGRHGIGTVYEDLRILEATWQCLEHVAELRIPSMNRLLVERTTHPAALEAVVRDGGDAWQAHSNWVIGNGLAKAQLAKLNVVDRDVAFDDPQIGFPSQELERRIRTRLGEDDRVAEFAAGADGHSPLLRSPFGTGLTRLTIPAFMARGVPGDARVEVLSSTDQEIVFRFGEKCFGYDRLGVRLCEPELADGEDVDE